MPRGILPVFRLSRVQPAATWNLALGLATGSHRQTYDGRRLLRPPSQLGAGLPSPPPGRSAHSFTTTHTHTSSLRQWTTNETAKDGIGAVRVPLRAAQGLAGTVFPPPASLLFRARRIPWNNHTNVYACVAGIRRVHQTSKPDPAARKPHDDPPPKPAHEASEPTNIKPAEEESIASSMSKYLHLPRMPHRPTKEELLAAANGFWERLRVRWKWLSIRSMRPWNADEWGAFVSWFILSHLVWILVGTTTFFSLIIFSINTVFAQETLARWIGDYLTQSAGVTVIFESAIVPKWKDGVIALRKVYVSRRPGQVQSSVSKGPATTMMDEHDEEEEHHVEKDDGNYTQFDLTIDTVNVTLSFLKWWNGKGLLRDVEIKGVRGEVDRRSVVWSEDGQNPLSYRHEHQPGDFELDYFKLDDLRVTVHQPEGFRPFEACIYSCELPQLRKQWMFYDLLSANNMSGSYDGSLFTIHTPLVDNALVSDGQHTLGSPEAWKKSTRLRIDNLRIDHLNRGVSGPFGWIYEGKVDIIADVMLPADEEEGLGKVVSDFYDQLDDLVTSNRIRLLRKGREEEDELVQPPNHLIDPPPMSMLGSSSQPPHELIPEKDQGGGEHPEEDRRYLVFDLRIRLNDVKAAVPLLTNDISYVNQALVRPIVAYINSKRTYIPVTCRFAKRRSDFDGSWTTFDSGLMDDMSAEVYTAFARNVEDQHNRVRRLKKVGGWTLSLLIHAICGGMAGTVLTP